jgi:hypothetical protein
MARLPANAGQKRSTPAWISASAEGCLPAQFDDKIISGQPRSAPVNDMIRKLKSGQYRLYSRKKSPRTGKRRNLGTFATRAAAEKHERAVQFFKRLGK